MGVARKWHFSTSGAAVNLGGVSGVLSEHRGSGIPLLGITSLNRHFHAQIEWTINTVEHSLQTTILAIYIYIYKSSELRRIRNSALTLSVSYV